MHSLPLLGTTALVLFGSRALIQAAVRWVVKNRPVFHHKKKTA
jgi:hypothetical protein